MQWRALGLGAGVLGVVAIVTALAMPPARTAPRSAYSNELPKAFPHISHEIDGSYDEDMRRAGEQFEREIARLHGAPPPEPDLDAPEPQPTRRRVTGAYYPDEHAPEPEPPTPLPAAVVALAGGGLVFGLTLVGGLVFVRTRAESDETPSEVEPTHGS